MPADLLTGSVTQALLLAGEMAPWLLLGFGAAGLLHAFVPVSVVARLLGGESAGAVARAALAGIPLPLCSCGVLPVAASIRRAGAGRGPTLTFLITTPVTGVDSLLATWAVLGGPFTLARLLASAAIGAAAGLLLSRLHRRRQGPDDEPSVAGGAHDHPTSSGLAARLREAVRYGLVELPSSMAGSVLFGLAVGGLIAALLPPGLVPGSLGSGIGSVAAATLIGIPLYVCATGSIPVAAALLMKGFTPGAALAFLIAGPATNMVAIAAVRGLLGRGALAVYLGAISTGAIGFGLLLDLVAGQTIARTVQHLHHASDGQTVRLLLGGVLFALFAGLWLRELLASRAARTAAATPTGSGERIVLNVAGMTCRNCAAKVSATLGRVEGVRQVSIDLPAGRVVVELDDGSAAPRLTGALERAGYRSTIE